MSKSLGNFLTVHDVVKTYDGEVIRLTLLSAHYRQPLDWSEQGLYQSKVLLNKLYKKLDELKDTDIVTKTVPVPVLNALCDDLNTPLVLAELNKLLKEKDGAELKGALLAIGDLLGILQEDPTDWLSGDEGGVSEDEAAKIEMLIAERMEAKGAKNFARADEIRDELLKMNIEIKDTRDGTNWEKV